MFITITVKDGKFSSDIRIDSEQKIIKGIEILRASGKLPVGDSPSYFRSEQNERLVSAYKTFNDEGIYGGDILTSIR